MNRAISVGRNESNRLQFGLASLLWITFAIAAALAYLRTFGAETCLAGLAVGGAAIAVGLALGKASGQVVAAVFWSLMGAMFGFLSAVGAPAVDPAIRCAWGAVGGVTAAVVALAWPQRVFRSLILGALVGGAVMLGALASLILGGVIPFGAAWGFDALFSPIAGAGMGLVVVAVEWAERQRSTSRGFAGAGLLLAVIVGNLAGAALTLWWT